MLKRTNAKPAVAATLVFINASVLLNGTTTIPHFQGFGLFHRQHLG